MKNLILLLRRILPLLLLAIMPLACFEKVQQDNSTQLRIFIETWPKMALTRSAAISSAHLGLDQTKSAMASTRASDIPNSDDFLLNVCDVYGDTIWSGRFGDLPDLLSVAPGIYSISAVSSEFSIPAFDAPQYGDTKVVIAQGGEVLSVGLYCSQLNCGLTLREDPAFVASFPNVNICMKDSKGALMHNYGDKRIAYFLPGLVSVTMDDRTIFSKHLEARQILKLTLSNSTGPAEFENPYNEPGLSIRVDTSRDYINDSYQYGREGLESNTALSVEQARALVEAGDPSRLKNIWLSGYIVGCATSTAKISFEAPFSKASNIVLGDRSSTTDRQFCLSVELPSGKIRQALNLMDNPELKGTKIRIRGDLVPSYYGIPGLKAPTEYLID